MSISMNFGSSVVKLNKEIQNQDKWPQLLIEAHCF